MNEQDQKLVDACREADATACRSFESRPPIPRGDSSRESETFWSWRKGFDQLLLNHEVAYQACVDAGIPGYHQRYARPSGSQS